MRRMQGEADGSSRQEDDRNLGSGEEETTSQWRLALGSLGQGLI